MESQPPLDTLIASFTSTLDAELARTLLGSHQIEARLEGDILVGAALPLSSALGGVRLLVSEESAASAKQLLEAHDKALAADRRRTDTADQKVARAYRLALVGLMLLPVLAQLISLVNLVRVPWSALSRKGRRHYVVGLTFDLIVLGSVGYWLIGSTLDRTPDVTKTMPSPGF
jgi:hypothetical protein